MMNTVHRYSKQSSSSAVGGRRTNTESFSDPGQMPGGYNNPLDPSPSTFGGRLSSFLSQSQSTSSSFFIRPTDVGLVAMGTLGALFFLFQKKLLPYRVTKYAARLFFWPTLPFTILRRTHNLWTPFDNTIAVGVAPVAMFGHVDLLQQQGFTGIVNLCEEYKGPVIEYKKKGMTQLYLPTVDHFEPAVDDIEEAMSFIDDHKKGGGKVYIHCKAGHGRSAAVALCWLMKNRPNDAPYILNQEMCERRHVRKKLYMQPNVKTFIQRLNEKEIGIKKSSQ